MNLRYFFIQCIIMIMAISSLCAQSPESFNYQAVIRDANSQILINQNVCLRFSILQNSISGNIIYSETHAVLTNQFGIVNLKIGTGIILSGNINSVSWGNDTYFLKVDLDATGGTNYQFMGISQLLSVPYALHAKTAENFTEIDGDSTNELQTLSISGDSVFLADGSYVILPENFDNDSTNEIQYISISNDSIYLINGSSIKLPSFDDNDADSTNELQILSF